MATEGAGQVSIDLCSCGICDRPTISPKCLPCLHTFCKSCLNSHILEELEANQQNGKQSFQCPRCGIGIQIPQDSVEPYTDYFKDDSFVNRLSEVISIFNVDKLCDICERSDTESPAIDWCTDCFESMCQTCKTVHLNGRATSRHSVIPLDELRTMSVEDITKRQKSTTCRSHEREIVKFYCDRCKIALCGICLESHKACRSVTTVDEAMNFHSEELDATIEKARECEVTQNSLQSDSLTVLEESIASSAEQIRATAAALRDKIDVCEREILDKLERDGNAMRTKLSKTERPNADHPTLLKSRADRFDAVVKYGNDSEILEVFSSIKDNINGMNESGKQENALVKVNFVVDPIAQAIQKDFKSLGEIEIEDCNTDAGLSSWGVTCTSREEIIVVDCNNKRVQKFSIEGNLIDHIQISEEPRDITCTGRNEVAITILKKFIFFLGTANDIRLRRKLKTEKQYDSISMANLLDKLLVSCMEEKSIDVIDIEGAILQSFSIDGQCLQLFQEPRYSTFDKNGNMYITDVAQGSVKGISKEGQLVFEYKPQGAHILRHPQDLCVDNIGNIFIVDYSNSRIHLITNRGQFQRFILGSENELVRPVAIHITPDNKLIIVQSDGMVKLFTYE